MTVCDFDNYINKWSREKEHREKEYIIDKSIEVMVGEKEITFKELRTILFE